MQTNMIRTLTALFIAATFLMVMMSSCMSKEESALNDIVNKEKELRPYELAKGMGLTETEIDYSVSKSLVTSKISVESEMLKNSVKFTSEIIKTGIISNYKYNGEYEEFRNALIAAKANLRYEFVYDNEVFLTMDIPYTDLE